MKGIVIFIFLILSHEHSFSQEVALTIPEKDLIPEGITIDPATKNFYLSSVFKNKIIRVSEKGVTDFISSNDHGFTGGVGLHVNVARRILWACSGNIMGNLFRTGVFAFDLNTGRLLKKVFYPTSSKEQFFNDLVIAKDGSVYITDTFGHAIWKWSVKMNEPLKLALQGNVPYPNGIEISPDNSVLFVATDEGLKRVEISNGKVTLLAMPAKAVSSKGLDGIALYKNSLIAVQNGVTNVAETKIVRYYLNAKGDGIEKVKVIDKGNRYFDIPTTLTIDGNELFVIANSQLGNLDQEKLKIKNPEGLTPTFILKYKLD